MSRLTAWPALGLQLPPVLVGLRGRVPHLPWLVAIIALFASPAKVLACAVCYGAAEGPFIRGLQLSVIALLGVTYFVIGGLLASFLILRRRAGSPSYSLPLTPAKDGWMTKRVRRARIPARVSSEGAC